MRVKRLEIQGFKSFKDKTVVHFDHSITGIVGPNGCGKSNIVDAFFWVMGEQSYKHMRGASSEDLIFNGSSRYSPLGLAEATLVMETDAVDTENAPAGASVRDLPVHLRAKEVSVTRRVYRSGEGEYFINGVPARLKDIQELFMDTGVGAKGYSVIEQGQIGKIVNAKPEDRRLLIEEAAGIAKYKARKKESLRKMEATHANLSRLNDVIQEIERNLGSLERQAHKAKQYRKFKEELLDKELTWGRRKNLVYRQKLDRLKAERDVLEQELTGLKAELQVAENSIESERSVQLTDTKTAEDLQIKIRSLTESLSEKKSSLELSRRRQGDLSSQLESLEAEQQELNEVIASEKERLEIASEVFSVAEQSFKDAEIQGSEASSNALAARQSSDMARRELEQKKRTLMNDIAQSSDLQSRGAMLGSRAESALLQSEKLAAMASSLEEKVAVSREERDVSVARLADLKSRKENQALERDSVRAEVQSTEQLLRKSESEASDAERKLTQVQSRLESLEELEAAHEGLGDGPKSALDFAENSGKSGSIKALTDGFDVTPGFESAVSGWLEGRLESLIALDGETALSAIEHLSQEKSGRVSISIARTGGVQSSSAGNPASAQEKAKELGFEVLGMLSEKVRPNGKFSDSEWSALNELFSGVVLVGSMNPLKSMDLGKFFSNTSGTLSLVTSDGSVLESSGVIRGGAGASNSQASILGRKQAIVELKAQVESDTAHCETLRESCETLKENLEVARARFASIQAEIQTTDIEVATVERDVHQAGKSLKDLESQLELSQLEATEMKEEAERARSERESVESKLQEIQARRGSLEAEIEVGEVATEAKIAESQRLDQELQALKIHEASLKERSQSLKRELESGLKMLSDREKRLAEVVRTLERASSEHSQHTGGDDELKSAIETLTYELAEAQEVLSQVKDRLEQASAKLGGTLEKIKELHKTGDSKMSAVNTLSLEIEKLASDLGHLVQNLEEKYGQGCLDRPVTSPIQEEMTEPVVTHEMTAEEEQLLGEEVERLRERIRRLGEVNVMAIEEFEESQKRHQYLVNERADLEKSIDNLKEAIEHINKTSEERFRKAFQAIAERFERLFPIIFGGGQAKLSLVYPEGSNDILEAGVDILAQPPGKKIVNIGLLSGGEKALTAVSLIFAIFMVKPSPFCVLDEVDAPLDDANIGKFNALLKEMSSKSQFIIITHNKKTMELNDTLYGVTMEEPGVSKMVSIEMQ